MPKKFVLKQAAPGEDAAGAGPEPAGAPKPKPPAGTEGAKRPDDHADDAHARVTGGGIAAFVGARTGGPRGRRLGEPGHAPRDYAAFARVLGGLLRPDPRARLAPAAALRLPFFAVGAAGAADGAARNSEHT